MVSTLELEKAICIIAHRKMITTEKVRKISSILERAPCIIRAKITNLILRGVNLFSQTGPYRDRITLLHFAARCNNVEIAKLLIDKRADVNAKSGDDFGNTPLHEAAYYGNKEIAELLLSCNANIESKNCLGSRPLHEACAFGQEVFAKMLLEKGADINAVTTNSFGQRQTPLHIAIDKCGGNGYLKIVKMLLGHGANIEVDDLYNGAPLHIAVFYGKIEVVKLLLEAKANVNAKNERGETPLHLVANGVLDSSSEERCTMAELLLEYGADVHTKDENGDTPLHAAALQRCRRVVELFVEHGAKIDEMNDCGETALQMSCFKVVWNSGNQKVDPESTVEYLIEQTLKKNPSSKKPQFLDETENERYNIQNYSEYWDSCKLKYEKCSDE